MRGPLARKRTFANKDNHDRIHNGTTSFKHILFFILPDQYTTDRERIGESVNVLEMQTHSSKEKLITHIFFFQLIVRITAKEYHLQKEGAASLLITRKLQQKFKNDVNYNNSRAYFQMTSHISLQDLDFA